MAGSYNHCIEKPSGQLLVNEDLVRMVENLGDAYEAIEELYGMVWFLAARSVEFQADDNRSQTAVALEVEFARQHYTEGLNLSPGTEGRLSGEEV